MPDSVSYARERYVLSRAIIAQSRLLYSVVSGEPAASPGLPLVVCAAYIGQYERRPMTIHKIAAFLGRPRPTIARRVGEGVSLGVLRVAKGGKVYVSRKWLEAPETIKHLRELVAVYRNAGDDLSKMDNLGA
jgi:hypothetical protein